VGQQQLLLLVLGIIIVGMSVYGVGEFIDQQIREDTRDRCRDEAMDLCVYADQYKLKPKSIGGGGGTYTGFTLPKFFIDEPDIGYWVVGSGQNVQIYACSWGQGAVKGDDGNTAVAVLLTKNGNSLRIDKLN
jgi:hypothetical protein